MEKSKIIIRRRSEGRVRIEKNKKVIHKTFRLAMNIDILKDVIAKLNPECIVEII